MPTSPPIACKCGGRRTAGVCDRCGPRKRQNQKAHDERRGTAAERGYGWKWRNENEDGAADLWLKQSPLCSECEWYSQVTPATLVDHKLPHKGDMELFWDQGNWQSLCRPCHQKKTNREQRAMNKYVICGEPGSGKTTWVKQHAQRGDLVFDADYLVSQLFTSPLHEGVDFGMPMVERLREAAIDWLLNYPDRKAFIIQTNKEAAAQTAHRIGAEVIDCDALRKGIPI